MKVQNFPKTSSNQTGPLLNATTGGFSYSAYVICYLLVNVVISIVLTLTGLQGDGKLYLSYLIAPIALVIAIPLIMKFRKLRFSHFVQVKCHPKYYLISALLIFGVLFSLGWLNSVSISFFKLFGYVPRAERYPDQTSMSAYLPNLSGGYIVLALLVIAVLPAVFEETFFRGLLLKNCQNGLGDISTIFIVGFCFSLYHASPEQTVYQFVCGCLFAFLAIRAGSYLPSVCMHFVNNAFIIIAYACGWVDEAGNLILSSGGNIALIVLSAASLIGGLVWLILDKKPLQKQQKGEVRNFFLYASVGILVLAILWFCSLFGLS